LSSIERLAALSATLVDPDSCLTAAVTPLS
jgi:hypothetical protein